MTTIASSEALKVTGLVGGFKPEELISSLMAVERLPVQRMDYERLLQESQESSLRSVQTSLEALSSNAEELGFPTLFDTSQSATSSEPSRVSATVSAGAAIGGYEVGVTQLASAAQRTFSFTSPTEAQTISIDGNEVQVAAGETLSALAGAINSDKEATVYAAAVGETLVLSSRQTGSGSSFIEVLSPGGALVEVADTAKEGKDAEYTVDGVAGVSASNTLTEAIPGVELTLGAVTGSGPVTIDVSPPSVDVEKVVEQVKSFVTQYNATIGKLQSEISAKPPSSLAERAETGIGTLFGSSELTGLVSSMRTSVYTPIAGLPAEMSSLASIGISSGSTTSSSFSESSVEGKLTLDEATLEEALKTNPEGVRKMLEGWTKPFRENVEAFSGPGGTIASQLQTDETQASYIGTQITTLTETLELRQHNLEARYTALEVALEKYNTQSTWLASQIASLEGGSESSSSAATTL
jgi:flagellar hook-associated protein 2